MLYHHVKDSVGTDIYVYFLLVPSYNYLVNVLPDSIRNG